MGRKTLKRLEDRAKKKPGIFDVDWEMRWYKHDVYNYSKQLPKIFKLPKTKK